MDPGDDEGPRLVRAVALGRDAAAEDALVAWLARRLHAASDLVGLAASLLGELPEPRRARVMDAAAARAGVAYGAGALVVSPWLPSECWALAADGSALLSAAASNAVLVHGEDLVARLELDLPDPDAFIHGPRAAAVDGAALVVARHIRSTEYDHGHEFERHHLRFDRYDRVAGGWSVALTHPDIQVEDVWIGPDLGMAVSSEDGEMRAFDLRPDAATPGIARRRPAPETDVTPAGFLGPGSFLLLEEQTYGGPGRSRAVVWDLASGEDAWVGPWQEAWTHLAATPGSPWVLAWRLASGGEARAWRLAADDLAGPGSGLGAVPALRTGRVSPDGRWVVGRGERAWVLDTEGEAPAAPFRAGRGIRVQDANDAGLVVVGWNQPQVLRLGGRTPVRAPWAPASNGGSFRIGGGEVVLALRGDGVRRAWDRASGACAAVFTDTPVPEAAVHLVTAEGEADLAVLDPETGDVQRRHRLDSPGGALASSHGLTPVDVIAATPDGRVVLAYRLSGIGKLAALDVEAGAVLWELEGHPVDDPGTPDGGVVVLGDRTNRRFPFRLLDLATGAVRAEVTLPEIGGAIPRMACDPATGDCWLFSSQAVVRVDPTQGTAEEVELPGMTRALAFDGTGRWRARAVEPKVLVLEDQVTGAEVRRWETTGWIEPPLAFAEGSLWALVDSVLRRFDLP